MRRGYDPGEHEPLSDEPWNEERARPFVSQIVREADEAFDPVSGWPLHPEDRYGEEAGGYRGIYCGAAGVMWALHRLARGEPREGNRMQWCHGAPGIVSGLAAYPATYAPVEQLLAQAGEAIWRAGPLKKGPSFCHRSAGNGYALLRLWQRTGEALWLERAQKFAMHAMRQVDDWRAAFNMPAYSLWTGELGVALFAGGVLRKDASVLALDVL